MKVQIISKESIKPSIPTPLSLKNYKISLIDELAPILNVPLILYYPAAANSPNNECSSHLKISLAETLTKFYPLAGRYMKDSHSIDCSDQGAEVVLAQVDIRLADLLDQGVNLKTELLNNYLPSPLGAADEITDPLLAVQVNTLDCDGLAIGVCISHRVADISTISSFIKGWARTASWGRLDTDPISPSFDSGLYFPGRGLPGSPLGFPRSKENIEFHKVVTKLFYFNKEAISRIRSKATRVQSVFGIICKAFADVYNASKHGHSRDEFIVFQPVNMRERTIPPLSKYLCGNLYLVSTSQFVASESKNMEFQDFADLLGNSVKSTLEDCAKILSSDEDEQMMIINPFIKLNKSLSNSEMVNICTFSSWCKSPIYEADFGWGKPIWVSSVNIPIRNHVILIDDKEGDRIEAWVSLDEKDMPEFEQNWNIKNLNHLVKHPIVRDYQQCFGEYRIVTKMRYKMMCMIDPPMYVKH